LSEIYERFLINVDEITNIPKMIEKYKYETIILSKSVESNQNVIMRGINKANENVKYYGIEMNEKNELLSNWNGKIENCTIELLNEKKTEMENKLKYNPLIPGNCIY
jgi:hypothetical protein